MRATDKIQKPGLSDRGYSHKILQTNRLHPSHYFSVVVRALLGYKQTKDRSNTNRYWTDGHTCFKKKNLLTPPV